MITILTHRGSYRFEAANDWSRDAEGDAHVYDGDETLATFDAASFVAALQATLSEETHADLASTHDRHTTTDYDHDTDT